MQFTIRYSHIRYFSVT